MIIPVQKLSQEEKTEYGENLVRLALLSRADLPTVSALVISPPEAFQSKLVKKLEVLGKEALTHSSWLGKDFLKFPLDSDLENTVKKIKLLFFQDEYYFDKSKLWDALLRSWVEEFRTKAARSNLPVLTPKVVYLPSKSGILAEGYFDPDLGEIVIKPERKLGIEDLQKIDRLILAANKKLVIPQVYKFLVVAEPEILSLSPFTQTKSLERKSDVVFAKGLKNQPSKTPVFMTFLESTAGKKIESDGALLTVSGKDNYQTMADSLVFTASENSNLPIIFSLGFDLEDDVSGSLKLISQPKILHNFCEAFLFAKNKKSLHNVSILIPKLKSPTELEKVKRAFLAEGISRDARNKIWIEFASPENFLHLEEYLNIGFDGIVLDLDNLHQLLVGYTDFEKEFFKRDLSSLFIFLTPFMKVLHSQKINLLVKGELSILHDVLEFLIDQGVMGAIVSSPTLAKVLPEQLHDLERALIARRLLK